MKPLSIRCGTCDSKLRVTRPEMLGQKLKCPKCGAKVAVPSAADVEAAGADTLGPDESQQLRIETSGGASLLPEGGEPFSDFGDIDALLQAERKRRSPATESLLPKTDADAGSASTAGKNTKRAAKKSSADAENLTGSASGGSAGSVSGVSDQQGAQFDRSLLDPTASWTSAEAAARKRLMAWGAIAAIVGIIAIGAVVFLIRELTRPETVAQAPADPNPGTQTPDASTEGSSDPSTATESTTDEENPGDATADPESPDTNTTGNEPDSETPGTDPATDPVVDANPTTPDGVAPETPANPLESLLPTGPPETEDPSGTVAEDAARPFDLMLEDLSELGAIMQRTPFDKARELADQALRVAYRSQYNPQAILLDRPKPRDVKLDQQLAIELHGVAIEPLPLAKFLDFVSRMTGVAIQVEPLALRAAEVSMTDLVTPSPTATNLQNLLSESLLPLGLGYAVEGELIIISFPNDMTAESRDYDITGLGVIGTSNPELLTEVVKAMIAPSSWSEGSGHTITVAPGSMTIVQRPKVHYQIAAFLAQWSAAVAGTEPPAGSVVSESEAESRARARELLAQRISIERLQPIPLKQLASELAEVSEGTILVDWRVLVADGWTGDTELPCNVFDQPLSVALDDTLRSAGLAFRVLDAQTLQITTLPDLLEAPEVRFFDVRELIGNGITATDLAERLPQVFRPVGVQDPSKRFFFDPDRAMLIAALPQPQQQALERFLGAWTEFSRPVTAE